MVVRVLNVGKPQVVPDEGWFAFQTSVKYNIFSRRRDNACTPVRGKVVYNNDTIWQPQNGKRSYRDGPYQ